MKILFFISNVGHGRGGHLHSLNTISREIGKYMDVGIVSIGNGKSPVIQGNPYFKAQISFDGYSLLKFRTKLLNILEVEKPDVLHTFDEKAFNLLMFFVANKYPFVHTKCGGPNPINFPLVDNLIVFSVENFNWFKKNERFRKTNIYLVPNRVRPVVVEPRENLLKDENFFTFMRIARIASPYKKSITDSIDMINRINKESSIAKLYVVGVVQDAKVYQELKTYAKDSNVCFLSDHEYTTEASKMLYLADAVVATGRGVMEAASLGLPVLTPASNSSYPVLLTGENINNFFETNFSQRNRASTADLEKNWNNILNMINNKAAYEVFGDLVLKFFAENFDVGSIYERYIQVYNTAVQDKMYRSKFLDIKYRLKALYGFFLRRNG